MASVQTLQKTFLPSIAPEDFFLLVAHITKKERVFLLAHPEYTLTPEVEEAALKYLERRLKHEPVAYIVGHKEFYGREFLVTPATLIPRPETELLIEESLKEVIARGEVVDIVDIGTGSGNIIITIASELSHEDICFYGIDISIPALAIAKKNAAVHHVDKKITFLKSDLLERFLLLEKKIKKERHLIITANLPYLSQEIYTGSNPDVHAFEPESALVSEDAGLNHYIRLIKELRIFSPHYLSTTFFFEISPEQSRRIKREIMRIFPAASLTLFQDLSGRDRLIKATI